LDVGDGAGFCADDVVEDFDCGPCGWSWAEAQGVGGPGCEVGEELGAFGFELVEGCEGGGWLSGHLLLPLGGLALRRLYGEMRRDGIAPRFEVGWSSKPGWLRETLTQTTR